MVEWSLPPLIARNRHVLNYSYLEEPSDGEESGEGDRGLHRILPLQTTFYELSEGDKLHHKGLYAHHVVQEDLTLEPLGQSHVSLLKHKSRL